jgi:hypothetical protein
MKAEEIAEGGCGVKAGVASGCSAASFSEAAAGLGLVAPSYTINCLYGPLLRA